MTIVNTFDVWDINPEPWRAPGVARYGPVAKDGKLVAYQEALREEFDACEPIWVEDVPIHVQFYFWRSSAHGKPCDVTNLQKATEDALQGLLYYNDKMNHHVESILMEQTPTTRPYIIIKISKFTKPEITQQEPVLMSKKFQGSSWQPSLTEDF